MSQEPELTNEFLITKEFHTSEAFSLYIETEAQKRNIALLEMLMEYCTEKDVDQIGVASMITPTLKEKIQVEAENLNLLVKTTNKLP